METETFDDVEMLRPDEPVFISLGIAAIVLPAAMAFQVAAELKRDLLDKFELLPGVPTLENPNPAPMYRRKQ